MDHTITLSSWGCCDSLISLVLGNPLPPPRLKQQRGLDANKSRSLVTCLSDIYSEHNDAHMIEGQHVRSIDTGELVWAVAFGCGTAVTTPNSVNLNWWRYRVPRDLILATGLHSGKIRTWNVASGASQF